MREQIVPLCLIAVLSTQGGCQEGVLLGVDVAPTMSAFAASPSLVVSGSPTEVTWIWTYANTPQGTTCTIDHDVGTITPGGKTRVTLTEDTVFTLTCTNSEGADTSQTTIATTSDAIAPTLASFAAEPALAISGQQTEVSWNWSYTNTPTPAPECSIDQGVGTLDPEGKTSVTLSENTVFTLTCTNSAGSDTAQTTIATTSTPVAPELAAFSATPSAIVSGSATDVTWVWSYANTPAPAPSCTIDQDVGTITSGKATSVTLTGSTTFTLTCSNSAGSDEATVEISTTQAPVAPAIESFSTSPQAVTEGQATNVTWVWSYANTPTPAPSCTIDHGVGTITSGKATSVTLTGSTTFTLTCSNSAGSDEATVEISATQAPVAPVIESFSTSPQAVPSGQATNVTWSWSYANAPTPAPGCTIDQGVGTITSGNATSITLTDSTIFTLTCSNSAGSHTAKATVTVVTGSLYIGSDGSLNFIEGQATIEDEDREELRGFLDTAQAAALGVSSLGVATATSLIYGTTRVVVLEFDYEGQSYIFDFDTVHDLVFAYRFPSWEYLGGNRLFGSGNIGSSFADTTELLTALLPMT